MLFTVSLASFLVPFISAASLPVLLQNLNTTSLTTSPVTTPLSVTGRLKNTSISTLTLTTNYSSLGVVIAQAYYLPPRYPPGYPDQPYDYFVRYSQLRIHCWKFKPDPLQNAENLDILFAKLHRKYSDPRHYSVHLWSDDGAEYYWLEGDERIGQSGLSLNLPLARDRPDFNMTYGEFSNVLIGLNHIRHDYPMLEIDTEIYREGDSREIGLMWLQTYDPMTEELLRKAE